MTDEILDKCLKELQSTDSLSKRMAIQEKYGISDEDICERCKSAHKSSDLGTCIIVEWCRWDLGFEWFRKERQSQNSRDCKNFLDNECIKHQESCSKENHEKCMTYKHFECLPRNVENTVTLRELMGKGIE